MKAILSPLKRSRLILKAIQRPDLDNLYAPGRIHHDIGTERAT